MEEFWNKWMKLNQLEQEKLIKTLIPTIERYFRSIDNISNVVGKQETLRLKAAFINSYFDDLYGVTYEKAINENLKQSQR